MKSKGMMWALVAVIGLMIVACRSNSNDVATLKDVENAGGGTQGRGDVPS